MMLKQYFLVALWVYDEFSQKCNYHVMDSKDYVGCFVDSPHRLLPHLMFYGGSTDNNRCILQCRDAGFMYAGTEGNQWCFCGNNPWQYTAADVDPFYIQNYDCNLGCVADSMQICGGLWRLSVYRTGVTNDSSLTIRSRKVERKYKIMDGDKKMNDIIAEISNVGVMSTLRCGALCSMNDACTGFVYSTITGMCQLHALKYHDLCDYTLTECGSSIYMVA